MYIYISYIFLIYSSIDEYLVCFYSLAIVNGAMYTVIKMSLQNNDLISFRYIPSSGITLLYASSIFNFFRNLHPFHSGCAKLYPY